MSDLPTDANFWIKIWAPIGAVLSTAIALSGISSRRISKVEEKVQNTHEKFVGKPDCRDDREGLRDYVHEIKTDLHLRMDRMENNILKAIRGSHGK